MLLSCRPRPSRTQNKLGASIGPSPSRHIQSHMRPLRSRAAAKVGLFFRVAGWSPGPASRRDSKVHAVRDTTLVHDEAVAAAGIDRRHLVNRSQSGQRHRSRGLDRRAFLENPTHLLCAVLRSYLRCPEYGEALGIPADHRYDLAAHLDVVGWAVDRGHLAIGRLQPHPVTLQVKPLQGGLFLEL